MSERFSQKHHQEAPDENPQSSVGESKDLESPNRRNFLKVLLAAGALAVVGSHPLKEIVEETVTPERLEKEFGEYVEKLKSEYSVEIDFNAIPDTRGSSSLLSLAERRDFARDIYEAVQLYPKSYVATSGLKTVQGVKHLALKEAKDPLMSTRGYFAKVDPGRIVLSEKNLIDYPLAEKFGWGSSELLKAVFHHEFYHQCDSHIHDATYNHAWKSANMRDGANSDSISLGEIFGMRKEGFASAYGALGGPAEDRAEIASVLFTDPVAFESWAAQEKALRDKEEVIKKEYFEYSGGILDETYWKLRKEGDMQAVTNYLALRESMQVK
jgi:hypothetical protein